MHCTALALLVLLQAPAAPSQEPKAEAKKPADAAKTEPGASLLDPRETMLANLRQLTFEGENAEAYFSFDSSHLIFQSTSGGLECDQIFTMKLDGSERTLVSTGKGRCTCSYYLPGDKRILFASTHLADAACPPQPDRSQGYVWAIYAGYDIFEADIDGKNVKRITDAPGYDAEATVSPDGKKIVFTSTRDGDLELYSMNLDGSELKRLTDEVGYDGGAFFSPDSKQLCYRASHPTTKEATDRYKQLLDKGLIEPRALELYVMNADGTNKRQITHNGKANFCPFFTPDAKHLLFSSNLDDPKGREFDIYMVALDGGDPVRVTFAAEFDGFPMISPDGKKIAFASNRGGKRKGETDIFVADWKGPR